jgi:hypothetical protein
LYAALLIFPDSVSAQRAVLLPTEGSASASVIRDTVAAKVAAGLEAEGFTVVGPDDRATGLLECESGDCARAVLASVSADFGVAVAVWSRSRGGQELAITVYMPDASSRDFAIALDEEPEPEVRGLVSDVARSVRSFEPEHTAPGARDTARTRASAANYVLGGVGLAYSLTALGFAFGTVAQRGDCVSTASGDCSMPAGLTREVQIGPRTLALFVSGGVVAAASTYLLLKRPRRVSVSPSESGVFLSTEGTF